MTKLTFLIAFLVFATFACSKPDNSEEDIIPSNLTLNASVSTDSSGTVLFTASATNAVAYTFDFGNGSTEVTATGIVTYHYISSGIYTVKVTAQSSTAKKISESIVINIAVAKGLVWSDDFDSPGAPNSSKWGYDLGAGGWGNRAGSGPLLPVAGQG